MNNKKTFEENFKTDIGAHRLITNLVFPTIRNFNFNPTKYLPPNNLFQKITIKGSKAFNLMLENPSINPSLDVDTDIFLNKDIINNINPNKKVVNLYEILPQITKIIDDVNVQEQLEYLAVEFEKEFNSKVNFTNLIQNSNNYTNMMYIIQLDAIMNKYINSCKNGYLVPSIEDKKRCYNCKVVHTIKQIPIQISDTTKSLKKAWLLKFAFQFDFKETFITREWADKGLTIPFFDITVANPFLQIENFKNKLDVEISPALYIIRPNLILDNLLNMASQPDFFKKNKAKNRYNKFMHIPFDQYSCSIIDKLSPKKNQSNFNEIAKKRMLIKNNPVALARSEEELYKQQFGNATQKELDNFILDKLDGNNTMLQKLTPQQKQEYKKQFIHTKLSNIGKISNINKHITTNISGVETRYSNILAPYKEYLNVFYNAHSNYNKELQKSQEKCSQFTDLQKQFSLSNVNYSKNNVDKLSGGILTKYKKDTTADNYFPLMFYNIYKQTYEIQSLFYGSKLETYKSPIIKFTSFSYWKFFTNIESPNRIKNTVWPKPQCLDNLEINQTYFFNTKLPDINTSFNIISRDFLSQHGFLIIIYPNSYLQQPIKPNIRKNTINVKIGNKTEKKEYKFYNNNVKFIKKIPSYQKVVIDGKVYLDAINILIFHELP